MFKTLGPNVILHDIISSIGEYISMTLPIVVLEHIMQDGILNKLIFYSYSLVSNG